MMHTILTTWFARPALLLGLTALPLLLVLSALAWLRRRRAIRMLGVRRYVSFGPSMRRWRGTLLFNGLLLLAVACAGPQWGRDYGQTRGTNSDVVVVLDLSRSMQAEQPSRQERALRLLYDLADTLQSRGGRRVALVVFAAEARLLFPLTPDYDHFRHCLRQIEREELPPLLPGPDTPLASGTRIGAGLRQAVAAADVAHGARPAIVLLSDGDDPAANDEEWLGGVLAARAEGIHIHVVAVGDPDQPRTIPEGAEVLRYRGQEVRTRLNEPLLQEIARRTGGEYLPAYTHFLPLGTLVSGILDQQPVSPGLEPDDALPVFRQQYLWFLAPALGLLLLSLCCNEGPTAPRSSRPSRARQPAMVASIVTLIVGATVAPDVEPLVRHGNAAFAAGDFDEALRTYEEGERGATDPGLLAFNRAAAHFRIGRYAEAALGYRQCLDDDRIPAERRPRAHYDLGTALMKQAGGASPSLLRQAVTSFRACLAQPDLTADLRADARHNLELAQLLWLRARAANPNDPNDGGPDSESQSRRQQAPGPDAKGNQQNVGTDPNADPRAGQEVGKDGKPAPGAGAKDMLNAGSLQVLPDTDDIRPLPPAEADEQLERIIERIAQERRSHWQQTARPTKDARNW
jgi:Ca-activated chloride channel family protein